MKLSECTMGKIVYADSHYGGISIGMIIGITNNAPSSSIEERGKPSRAIPLVKWAHSESPSACHHGNLKEYRDDE